MTEPDASPPPVVPITVDPDGALRVNGVVVEHDGTQDVRRVAVRALVHDVVRVLGVPVVVIATEPTGVTRMRVDLAGAVTDVETVTAVPAPEPVVLPAPTERSDAQLAGDVEILAEEPDAEPDAEPDEAYQAAQAAQAAGPVGTAGSTGLRDRVTSPAALAATGLALVLVLALLIGFWATRPGDAEQPVDRAAPTPAATTGPTNGSSTVATDLTPVSPAASGIADVRATTEPGVLRVTLGSDAGADDVQVVLSGAVEQARTVAVPAGGRTLSFRVSAAGTAQWSVRTAEQDEMTGVVTVLGPAVS